MDLSRRDLLVGLLQALFLALFPWLRNERGAEVVRAAAEHMVSKDPVAVERAVFKMGEIEISMGVKGYEVSDEMFRLLAVDPGIRKLASYGRSA